MTVTSGDCADATWTPQHHRRARKMLRRYELTGCAIGPDWMADVAIAQLVIGYALVRMAEALARIEFHAWLDTVFTGEIESMSDEIDWLAELDEDVESGPWRSSVNAVLNSRGGLVAECRECADETARLIATLRNLAPELLAVLRVASEEDRFTSPCACGRCQVCRLAPAIEALRMKLREARDG